jgi:hypothetical protein
VIFSRAHRPVVVLLAALTTLAPGMASAQRPRQAGVAHSAAPANAVLPGFETLDDGSTRLFVDLSAPVSYETRAAKGSITYVLKATKMGRRNNGNPLVTTFFNTPVTTARLVPHGHDLWFVVDVRADAQPAVSVDPKPEGGATLSIHFPKGDYLPPEQQPAAVFHEPTAAGTDPGAPAAAAPSAAAVPRAAPMNHSHTGGGGGSGGHSHRHGGSSAPTN